MKYLILIVISIMLVSCEPNHVKLAKDYRNSDFPNYTANQILTFVSQDGSTCDWNSQRYGDGLYEVTGSSTISPGVEIRMVFKINALTNSVMSVRYQKYLTLHDKFAYVPFNTVQLLFFYKEEQQPNYSGPKLFSEPKPTEEAELPENEKESYSVPKIVSPGPNGEKWDR